MEDTNKTKRANVEAQEREIETISKSTRSLTAAFKAYQDMVIYLRSGIMELKGKEEGEAYIAKALDLPLDQIRQELDNLVTQSVFSHLEADDKTI